MTRTLGLLIYAIASRLLHILHAIEHGVGYAADGEVPDSKL